jgi:hypothetical protein
LFNTLPPTPPPPGPDAVVFTAPVEGAWLSFFFFNPSEWLLTPERLFGGDNSSLTANGKRRNNG